MKKRTYYDFLGTEGGNKQVEVKMIHTRTVELFQDDDAQKAKNSEAAKDDKSTKEESVGDVFNFKLRDIQMTKTGYNAVPGYADD